MTDKPHNQMDEMPTAEQMERIDEEMQQDEENAAKIDAYKMVAVVDAGRSFANNEVSISTMSHFYIL